MAESRKVGRKRSGGKVAKKRSWEAQELDDIKNYWQPKWNSKEGKRQSSKRTT
jgi:hypothetical protein